DLKEHNIWALFIDPHFESRGIGKRLHQIMMDWYFSKTDTTVWLSTSPGTRAEKFYRIAGWKETGIYGKGEIKFELTAMDWKNNKQL
ncbi:MAG TPA: GNAT family N-acetyltransferase, partial [Ferruginibacter sp.]|nr:GNAT family N-acetyltransferase [Ferruginibacter sp.]